MNAATRYAIGIDVGGTKLAGGVVNITDGTVLLQETIPTQAQRGGATVLTDCIGLIERLYHAANVQGLAIAGIGLAVCELVDPGGNVTSAYNFDWRTIRLQELLPQWAPVVVTSDARAAALAEAQYGAGAAYNLFAYVTVGTGISSTIVHEGRPLAGARGNALVLASMPLTAICPTCGALNETVLEEFAGGPALVRRYNAEAGTPITSGHELFAAVERGDALASKIVRTAGEALGVSIAFLCNVIDPEAVIIGGGLGLAGGLYWESMVEATRRHIYAWDTRQLPIVTAALGIDVGIIGAAAAAFV